MFGDNYVGDDQLGRKCHKRRMAFEQNLTKAGMREVKRELYRKLAQIGLGREVIVVGRKLSKEITI